MAGSTYLPQMATESAARQAEAPRHALFLRVTHWLAAGSFFVLLLSGIAILLAHPRLYWGETGSLNTPSLIDLPLPMILDIPIRGPGRYLHFLAAWIMVGTGAAYFLWGLTKRHFGRNVLPARADLSGGALAADLKKHLALHRPSGAELASYNVSQKIAYTAVVFVLLPVMIWTGLAMSPAVTSVAPALVTSLGGQQSARTIHFFASAALVLFALVHIFLAWWSGVINTMITGQHATGRKSAKKEAR